VVAELKHVAGQALDREVLVDRADHLRLRLQQHRVIGRVGNGPARRDRRQRRAAPPAQDAVDRVPMQMGAAAPASRVKAVGQHSKPRRRTPRASSRGRAWRVARARTAPPRSTPVTRPRRRSAAPARRAAWTQARGGRAHRAGPHPAARLHSHNSSRDSGNRRPFGTPLTAWPERPTRCSSAAIERVEPSWHTRSTSPMSIPSSSDAVATSARSSPRFRRCSASRRCSRARLPWCARDNLLADALGQVARRALGQTPRIDEDQRGAVLAHQLGEPVVDLLPDFARHHRLEGRRRQLDRQVARPNVARVDDRAGRHAGRVGPVADQEARNLLDRFLRGRQPDSHRVRARSAPRGVPATAPGARRACSAPARGSRRRSPCGWSRASGGRTGWSAGCTAIRVS